MRYAAIFALLVTAASASPLSAEIAWEGKLRDAHAKAKQQGKLMLLHFFSDNCVWCERLEAGAFQDAAVANAINQGFVPVKVHAGKNPKLSQMFKVTKFPTDVIVTTDGKALSHQVSPQQPERYVAMLSGAQTTVGSEKTTLAASPAPTAAQAPAATAPPTIPPAAPAPAAIAASQPQPVADQTAAPTLPVQIPSPGAASQTTSNPLVASATVEKPATAPRENSFMLPAGRTNVNASMASARLEPAAPPQPEPTVPAAKETPELAVDGYCVVSVLQDGQWVEGKPEHGVIHLGKLYLFASESAKESFLADPMPFTPMLNEIDVVRFFEEKKIVPGRREWGVIDPKHNRMFFFADEAAMIHFENSFERYLDAAIEVMDDAVADANPGV